MKKISVIYWSDTGDTEAMAKGIKKGAEGENTDVKLINVGDALVGDVLNADLVVLGCPAMGNGILNWAVREISSRIKI